MQTIYLAEVLFYFISLFTDLVTCSEYTVIKINGNVTYQSKYLKIGDKIDVNHKERLYFGKDASIQVCAPGCQPASLELSKTRENSLANLVSALRSQLALSTKPRTTARRGEDYLSLQQFFAASECFDNPNPFLIIGQGVYPIRYPQFVQSSSKFFSLKYTYKGQIVYKKLPYNGNQLVIDYNNVYSVDKMDIKPSEVTNIQLVYINIDTNLETYVCHFKPVFIEPEDLATSLSPLIKTVLSQTSPEVLYTDYVLPYVLYNFGLPDEGLLKGVIRQRFSVKLP